MQQAVDQERANPRGDVMTQFARLAAGGIERNNDVPEC
jgi:hypothetical protein